MFRIWGKIIKDNRLIRDHVVEIPGKELSRTKKVYKALEILCDEFDLAIPIWLDNNNNDFIRHSSTRFRDVNFMESIDFDYLDFTLIEEDEMWE